VALEGGKGIREGKKGKIPRAGSGESSDLLLVTSQNGYSKNPYGAHGYQSTNQFRQEEERRGKEKGRGKREECLFNFNRSSFFLLSR